MFANASSDNNELSTVTDYNTKDTSFFRYLFECGFSQRIKNLIIMIKEFNMIDTFIRNF